MKSTTSITLVEGLFATGRGSQSNLSAVHCSDVRNRAWERFMEIYVPFIRNYARKKGPSVLVDDMPQEVILRLLRLKKPPVITADSRPGSFRRYLMTIVRRVIYTKWPAMTEPLESNTECCVDDDYFERWDRRWKINLLVAAMDRLRYRVNAVNYEAYMMMAVHGVKVPDVIPRMKALHDVAYNANHLYQLKSRLTNYLSQEVRTLENEIGDGTCIDDSDIANLLTRNVVSGDTKVHEIADPGLTAWLEAIRKILGDAIVPDSQDDQIFIRDEAGTRWWTVQCDTIYVGTELSSEIVLVDAFASGRHCVISIASGKRMIKDCDSTNGTRVNQQEIRSHELVDGDVIQLGGASLIYFDGHRGDRKHQLIGVPRHRS